MHKESTHSLKCFFVYLQTQWQNGDKVFPFQHNSRKGCGVIHCVDPLGKCGCDYIGSGCVSIHVTQSFESTWPLPLPTTEAKTMADAIGSIIRWPTHLLVQENAEFHNNDENVVEVQDASLIRDSWRKRRVQLWAEDGLQMLGEGVILLGIHMKPSTLQS